MYCIISVITATFLYFVTLIYKTICQLFNTLNTSDNSMDILPYFLVYNLLFFSPWKALCGVYNECGLEWELAVDNHYTHTPLTNFTITLPTQWRSASDIFEVLLKFAKAATYQLHNFLWAQILKNLSQKLFKFYNHITHHMEICW